MASSLSPPPPDSIQRNLFLCPLVHIYAIPPLRSLKGYTTTSWTPLTDPTSPSSAPVRTRLRVLETAVSDPGAKKDEGGEEEEKQRISTSVLLEDPATNELFAAAPYTDPAVVEPVLDSARFFALRVVGEGGRKAVLGIGFEERSEAIDFGIALQEVRKVQGMVEGRLDDKQVKGAAGASRTRAEDGARGEWKGEEGQRKTRDFSLKEGEMIKVDVGGLGRRKGGGEKDEAKGTGSEDRALFAIKPPPQAGASGTTIPLIPPPPNAQEVRAEKRRSRQGIVPEKGSAAELGFDDGEFGEFQ
ncbi:MAG: hypothetical protein LQ342_000881 [Letrouitia transgressa]|nr:MAG: hypothetical protein LQ342_000881 [Letrouitia transgressa]